MTTFKKKKLLNINLFELEPQLPVYSVMQFTLSVCFSSGALVLECIDTKIWAYSSPCAHPLDILFILRGKYAFESSISPGFWSTGKTIINTQKLSFSTTSMSRFQFPANVDLGRQQWWFKRLSSCHIRGMTRNDFLSLDISFSSLSLTTHLWGVNQWIGAFRGHPVSLCVSLFLFLKWINNISK